MTVLVNFVAAYYLLIFKKSSFNRKQYNNFLMGLQAVMGIFLALTGYTWTAVAHFEGVWPAGNIGWFIGYILSAVLWHTNRNGDFSDVG